MVFCPECRVDIGNDLDFCYSCGALIDINSLTIYSINPTNYVVYEDMEEPPEKIPEELKNRIDWLISSLDSESSSERNNAVKKLVKIGSPTFEPIKKATNSKNSVIRRKSCDVLRLIGDPRGVMPLTRLLTDSNRYVRRRAANALILIGDERAVLPLCQALNDSETKVRVRAATALGKIGDERAILSLVSRLDDSRFNVSEAAAEALQKMGSVGENALKQHQKETEAVIERERKLRGKEKKEESLRYLTHKNAPAPYEHVGKHQVKKLIEKKDVFGLIGCSIVTYNDSWLNYETDRERDAKDTAFRFVVNKMGEQAIEPLITLLNNSNHKIQLRSIEALKLIGDQMQYKAQHEFYDEYEDKIDVIDDIVNWEIITPNDAHRAAKNVWEILEFRKISYPNRKYLKLNETLVELSSNLDKLTSEVKNARFSSERENYDTVLDAANQIKTGINKYSQPFNQVREALFRVIKRTNNEEVISEAENAISYYYLLPIDCIFSKYGGEGEEKDEIRIVIEDNSSNGQSSRGGRTYSQQLIEENDNYMDDIISGLYGHRK